MATRTRLMPVAADALAGASIAMVGMKAATNSVPGGPGTVVATITGSGYTGVPAEGP